jgi:hypothetical protein
MHGFSVALSTLVTSATPASARLITARSQRVRKIESNKGNKGTERSESNRGNERSKSSRSDGTNKS